MNFSTTGKCVIVRESQIIPSGLAWKYKIKRFYGFTIKLPEQQSLQTTETLSGTNQRVKGTGF